MYEERQNGEPMEKCLVPEVSAPRELLYVTLPQNIFSIALTRVPCVKHHRGAHRFMTLEARPFS